MDDKPYVQLGHGRAYSNAEGINVILPHNGNRDGNHFYPRARRNTLKTIQALVEQLIVDIRASGETLWPAYPNPRITVIGYPTYPQGEYHWTAWDE